MSNSTHAIFNDAQIAYRPQDWNKCKLALLELLHQIENHFGGLQLLIETHVQLQEYQLATEILEKFLDFYPDEQAMYFYLADVQSFLQNYEGAIATYHLLLDRFPNNATGHFNLAQVLGRTRQFSAADSAYRQCLSLNIDGPEEVYLNCAVLFYRQGAYAKAIAELEQALAIKPDYLDAQFNYATIKEELGEKKVATEIYLNICQRSPEYEQVFERLANAGAINSTEHPLFLSAKQLLNNSNLSDAQKESLLFGLGKVANDCANYAQAYEYYEAGNALSRQRVGDYAAETTTEYFQHLKNTFNERFIQENCLTNPEADEDSQCFFPVPIFICGMFRSGSTLIEQVLAKHSHVTSGGELDFLNELISEHLGDLFDESFELSTLEEKLCLVRKTYLLELQSRFPKAKYVTDKRPDNFVHIGIIKLLFPNAKIIYTTRRPMDNVLSVFFQHLGADLPYANKIEDIAHYYIEHTKLMQHWRHLYSESIFLLEYEKFVDSQRSITEALLAYCELIWEESCLQFHDNESAVATASIWQVRQPLYKTSVDRWRNYQMWLPDIPKLEALSSN